LATVLETYFSPDNLKLAYYRMICWPERLVKDRFGIHAFGASLDSNINRLSEKIIAGNYKPQKGFKFYEPKSSGTQRTKTLLFIEDANPIITVNNGVICAGQNFTINPNGANTYTIQGGNAVVSPPSNASYTVIGTNSVTGCRSQAFATSNLIVNPNPTITVNSGAICAGQTFTINPNGANTYTIQGGNAVVSPPSNASYTVIGTNSITGCRSQVFATSSLTVNPNPTITVNSGAICAGQSFTINPNGANTYTIQGGNAVVSPTSNSSYTVAGTSTSGCKSQGFATSNLTVNPNPTITVNSGAICAGQNFTINPNGANTYTIQGSNAVVSPAINSSYTVAGTSTSGCKSQGFATSNLTVNANPTITVNSGFICAGENFTIYPNGANTYSIQGGNALVSPSISTTYTVIGTSSAGCESLAFATSSLTVNLCVGINNQNMDLGGVSIYPNPNNGEFTIELVSVNNTYITITNLLGQIIKTQKAELMNQIDLNLFDKGIYFISVIDNNQSVYRGSIIKE
jgi:propanediol utilization protein